MSCNAYALCEDINMNDLPAAIKAAMVERRIGQSELAQQTGLSQGHLSKVLRHLEMGRKTRERLQEWLEQGAPPNMAAFAANNDLREVGAILKRHAEELAALGQRLSDASAPGRS